ncbi:hypothetical protein AOQ84DRAFT_381195 [Glonium stellatum]|uniref:DUF7730 domain-containing protein n=1 Tax=Glonium stellatum TaxID=574774 RepID=A0A8E2JNI2_9PEZI|nr:hypothetical protein AOQ84DRAFT_381195 [Glonium stellatum]
MATRKKRSASTDCRNTSKRLKSSDNTMPSGFNTPKCNARSIANITTNSSRAQLNLTSSQPSNDACAVKTNFMDLPRELRDMVYRFALVPRPGHLTRIRYADAASQRPHLNDEPIEGGQFPEPVRAHETPTNQFPGSSLDAALNLFLTSKRVKVEAEEIFYRHSSFTMRIRTYQTNYGIFVWRTGCEYSFIHVKQYFSPSVLSNIRHLSMACAVSDSPIITTDQASVGRPGGNPASGISKTLCLGKSPGSFDTWLYCTWKQKIDFVTTMPALREINVCMCDCRWRDSNYVCSTNAPSAVLRIFDKAVKRRLSSGLPTLRVILESFYEVCDVDLPLYEPGIHCKNGKNLILSIRRKV